MMYLVLRRTKVDAYDPPDILPRLEIVGFVGDEALNAEDACRFIAERDGIAGRYAAVQIEPVNIGVITEG